jgi:hypothetical protein
MIEQLYTLRGKKIHAIEGWDNGFGTKGTNEIKGSIRELSDNAATISCTHRNGCILLSSNPAGRRMVFHLSDITYIEGFTVGKIFQETRTVIKKTKTTIITNNGVKDREGVFPIIDSLVYKLAQVGDQIIATVYYDDDDDDEDCQDCQETSTEQYKKYKGYKLDLKLIKTKKLTKFDILNI